MKKMNFLNKKFAVIVALSLVVIAAGVGTTMALLKDSTKSVKNTFELGSIETKIVEVASGTQKTPYVYNEGKNDCYVRMRAVMSPASLGEMQNYVIGLDTSADAKWKYHEEDGFFYYQDPVAPNSITEVPLFTEINPPKDENGKYINGQCDILLYQEAVQTNVSLENGKIIDDIDHIWFFYDNGFEALVEAYPQYGVKTN